METNGAKIEYFAQLENLFIKMFETQSEQLEEKCKAKIMSITYDKVEELMKRVEELETEREMLLKGIKTAFNGER